MKNCCWYSCSFDGKKLQKYQKLWIWFWVSSRKVFRYLFFPSETFPFFFKGLERFFSILPHTICFILLSHFVGIVNIVDNKQLWEKKKIKPKKLATKSDFLCLFEKKKNSFGCFSVEMFFINKFTYSENINPISLFHSSHYFCLLL